MAATIIGIDPHKSSHTATAISTARDPLGTVRVRATRTALGQLMEWAAQWPDRRWAIEGASGLGRLVAQQLVAAGESVVDVPATLVSQVRLLDRGHGAKTDEIDARAVAVVALERRDLAVVSAENHTMVLRMLSDRRRELRQERGRTVNRLHRHLRDLVPGGAPINLDAKAAAAMISRIRPVTAVDVERKQVARDLVADIRRLDKAIANNRTRCADAVAATATTLTDIYGISDVLAANIMGQIGDITRFPTSDHLASYAGTAPIAASSGEIVRHRLSRRGNRQLNHAIHLAAHVQTIRPSQGQDYLNRQLAAGKTRKEAMRNLKRQVTKAIYRALTTDAQRITTAGT